MRLLGLPMCEAKEGMAMQAEWRQDGGVVIPSTCTGHQITRWVYAALASLAGRRRHGKGVAREGRRTPLRPAVAGLSRRRKPRNVSAIPMDPETRWGHC